MIGAKSGDKIYFTPDNRSLSPALIAHQLTVFFVGIREGATQTIVMPILAAKDIHRLVDAIADFALHAVLPHPVVLLLICLYLGGVLGLVHPVVDHVPHARLGSQRIHDIRPGAKVCNEARLNLNV